MELMSQFEIYWATISHNRYNLKLNFGEANDLTDWLTAKLEHKKNKYHIIQEWQQGYIVSLNYFKTNGESNYFELFETQDFKIFQAFQEDHRSKCLADWYAYLCERMFELREERFRNTIKHKKELLAWFDTMADKYVKSKKQFSPKALSQRIKAQSAVSKQKKCAENTPLFISCGCNPSKTFSVLKKSNHCDNKKHIQWAKNNPSEVTVLVKKRTNANVNELRYKCDCGLDPYLKKNKRVHLATDTHLAYQLAHGLERVNEEIILPSVEHATAVDCVVVEETVEDINSMLLAVTESEKDFMLSQLNPITMEKVSTEFNELKEIGKTVPIPVQAKVGNAMVDFFTLKERLNTRGKYNTSYYEFVKNIEWFKEKQFVTNLLTFYEDVKNKNNTKNEHVVLKEVYNIGISSINIFRPLVAMDLYKRFNPVTVLDFTCGWGGRLVGACALNVPNYIGIDINQNLESPYADMCQFLNANSATRIQMFFEDAVAFDYAAIEYDMVFTSPPYYFIEKYSNNRSYGGSKDEMNKQFYEPLFMKSYRHLKVGGHYCLNVNQDIYEHVCVPLLGRHADQAIPLCKSKRHNEDNEYVEFIYVWNK